MDEQIFYKECFLLKANQYEALELLNNEGQLKIGTLLKLFQDKDEIFACALNGKRIGLLPKEETELICNFLKMGWHQLFKCRVSKYDEKADENKRFSIAIYINNIETTSLINRINYHTTISVKVDSVNIIKNKKLKDRKSEVTEQTNKD